MALLDGTTGVDSITGGFDADTINGFDGDDILKGAAANDVVNGGNGNDYLFESGGSNVLSGDTGNDQIYGSAYGSDTITGGIGNDSLSGDSSTDTNLIDTFADLFVFNLGDGQDVIYSGNLSGAKIGKDTLQFGTGITLDMLSFSVNGESLIIGINNTTDSITLENYFESLQSRPVAFLNIDGVTVNLVEHLSSFTFTQNAKPSGGNLSGTEFNDVLNGSGGRDSLWDGIYGNDILNGGGGDDWLSLSEGNDTADGGNGNDTIVSYSNTTHLNGGGGNDIVYGSEEGWDTIIGGKGNDTIHGDEGSNEYDYKADVFIFNLGDGQDTIRCSYFFNTTKGKDTIQFGEGITADMLRYSRAGNHLIINIDQTSDSITLEFWFNTSSRSIQYMTFNNVKASIESYMKHALIERTGTNFSEYVFGSVFQDSLLALDGDDYLDGGPSNDILKGGNGNDTLDGGEGIDTMVGGAGADLYIVDNSRDVVQEIKTINTEIDQVKTSASFTLGANLENLELTGIAAINGVGNNLSNVMIGNNAANVLDGGSLADTLIGGGGNDIYIVDTAKDVVDEASTLATEIDTVKSSVSFTLGANLENLLLTGLSNIRAVGNELDNKITGNNGNNTLDGSIGADTMSGGIGNDIYIVDNNGDVVIDSGTISTEVDMVQSAVSFTLGSNIERLLLTGLSSTSAAGNNLNNQLTGNNAANILDGRAGVDTLVGGAGNDIYIVDNINDKVIETSTIVTEDDTVKSSVSFSLSSNLENLLLTGVSAINATGNAINNNITGNAAANTIIGGNGKDNLQGGAGNDTLVGGAGTDTLAGSTGADIFRFVALSDMGQGVSRDVIKDFVSSQGDKVDLSVIDANSTVSGQQDFTFVTVFTNTSGQVRFSNGTLYLNTDSDSVAEYEIKLLGVSSVVSTDFIL